MYIRRFSSWCAANDVVLSALSSSSQADAQNGGSNYRHCNNWNEKDDSVSRTTGQAHHVKVSHCPIRDVFGGIFVPIQTHVLQCPVVRLMSSFSFQLLQWIIATILCICLRRRKSRKYNIIGSTPRREPSYVHLPPPPYSPSVL